MRSDDERLALNQALARAANEVVEDVASAWQAPGTPIEVRCECARAECRETLRLSRDEYEAVRSSSRQFVVLPEHVEPQIDRIAGTIRTYTLVEKVGEVAGDVADETNPRP